MVLDVWVSLLKRIGVKGLNLAYVGRWIGHSLRGHVLHNSIVKAAPIRGEAALGWLTHYGVGVGFAAVLYASQGSSWFHNPAMLPAMVVGACTVVAPLFVMQPAMGAGFAASKTPAPLANCARSLANHSVFGLGLYASAFATNWIRALV